CVDTGAQSYDACLTADTTPPATVDGEPVDCEACDRAQGAYCMAWACQSEFAAFGCCSQAHGSTSACSAEQSAVVACTSSSGKAKFDACIQSLVGRCFAP